MEALNAIRLITNARGRLPVAMLSADVTPEAKREALEAGFDAFLPKPIEALRLLEEVQALSSAAPTEENRRGEATARPQRPAAPSGVINIQTLDHLEQLSSSKAFMEKLVSVFLSDSGALLARIEQALAGRNFAEFRSLLHAMKGSAASMGTDRLTALCGSLGGLSDAELRLRGPGLLRSLSAELAAARGELERYVEERQRSIG
jgi:two-component system sensor histidine kinase RpfC